MKLLVETRTMKSSGEHGTPMLSARGKQTAVEILEFQSPSKIQAESRFMAHQKADDGAIAEEEGSENSENEDFVQNARHRNTLASQKTKASPKLTND